MMGERLKKAGIVPDRIIASTAKRAAQTAKRVAKGVGYDADNIEWQEDLYHCVPAVFEEVIHTVDDAVNTLFIVAHNPGITEFSASLDNTRSIHDMPTCATAGFEIDADRWVDFSLAKKKLFLYDTPKKDHE
jgi:phosphohistidine phosphatase